MDEESRVLAYIDEVIVGDRTSDAAEDSAGAAWAAYQRGEFEVPAWYKLGKKSSANNPYDGSSTKASFLSVSDSKTPRLTFGLFLKAMGVLFLVLLGILLVALLSGFFVNSA